VDTVEVVDFRAIQYYCKAKLEAKDYARNQVENLFTRLKDRITESFLDSCLHVLTFKERFMPFINKDSIKAVRIKNLFISNVLKPEITNSELNSIFADAIDKYSRLMAYYGFPNPEISVNVNSKFTDETSVDTIIQVQSGNFNPLPTLGTLNGVKRLFFKKQEKFYVRAVKKITGKFIRKKTAGILFIGNPEIEIPLEVCLDIFQYLKSSARAKLENREILRLQFNSIIDNLKQKVLNDREKGIYAVIDRYSEEVLNVLVNAEEEINPETDSSSY